MFRSDGFPMTRGHVALLWSWYCDLLNRYQRVGDFAEARYIRETYMTRAMITHELSKAIREHRPPAGADVYVHNGFGAAF